MNWPTRCRYVVFNPMEGFFELEGWVCQSGEVVEELVARVGSLIDEVDANGLRNIVYSYGYCREIFKV